MFGREKCLGLAIAACFLVGGPVGALAESYTATVQCPASIQAQEFGVTITIIPPPPAGAVPTWIPRLTGFTAGQSRDATPWMTAVGPRDIRSSRSQWTGEWTMLVNAKCSAAEDAVELGGRVAFGADEVDLIPSLLDFARTPKVILTYLAPFRVFGDQSHTAQVVEPSQPFDFAILARNASPFTAHDLKVVDSSISLSPGYGMRPNKVTYKTHEIFRPGGTHMIEPAPRSTSELGDLLPGQAGLARWTVVPTYSGETVSARAGAESKEGYASTIHQLLWLIRIVDVDGDHVPEVLARAEKNAGQYFLLSLQSPRRVPVAYGSALDYMNEGKLTFRTTESDYHGWGYYQICSHTTEETPVQAIEMSEGPPIPYPSKDVIMWSGPPWPPREPGDVIHLLTRQGVPRRVIHAVPAADRRAPSASPRSLTFGPDEVGPALGPLEIVDVKTYREPVMWKIFGLHAQDFEVESGHAIRQGHEYNVVLSATAVGERRATLRVETPNGHVDVPLAGRGTAPADATAAPNPAALPSPVKVSIHLAFVDEKGRPLDRVAMTVDRQLRGAVNETSHAAESVPASHVYVSESMTSIRFRFSHLCYLDVEWTLDAATIEGSPNAQGVVELAHQVAMEPGQFLGPSRSVQERINLFAQTEDDRTTGTLVKVQDLGSGLAGMTIAWPPRREREGIIMVIEKGEGAGMSACMPVLRMESSLPDDGFVAVTGEEASYNGQFAVGATSAPTTGYVRELTFPAGADGGNCEDIYAYFRYHGVYGKLKTNVSLARERLSVMVEGNATFSVQPQGTRIDWGNS